MFVRPMMKLSERHPAVTYSNAFSQHAWPHRGPIYKESHVKVGNNVRKTYAIVMGLCKGYDSLLGDLERT